MLKHVCSARCYDGRLRAREPTESAQLVDQTHCPFLEPRNGGVLVEASVRRPPWPII